MEPQVEADGDVVAYEPPRAAAVVDRGGSAIIPSSIPLLYLPPLLLACLILFGTWLARRRADERDRQVGSATSGPRSPVSA